MSENKSQRENDGSSSQTDGSALFVGQPYDLKWLFLKVPQTGSATHNSKRRQE